MQGVRFVALLVLLSCRGPQALPHADFEEPEPVEVPEPQPESGSPQESEGTGGAPAAEEPVAEGGARVGPSDCQAQPVTLDEVHSGRVRSNLAVSLPELSATSQKFLLSEIGRASCRER